MNPQRIRLSRQKGWRKPEGAMVVARPTDWGNPISISDVWAQFPSFSELQVATLVVRDFSTLAHRGFLTLPNWRFANGRRGPVAWSYPSVDRIRTALAGRDLCCWCPPNLPCHADVLLEIANGGAA